MECSQPCIRGSPDGGWIPVKRVDGNNEMKGIALGFIHAHTRSPVPCHDGSVTPAHTVHSNGCGQLRGFCQVAFRTSVLVMRPSLINSLMDSKSILILRESGTRRICVIAVTKTAPRFPGGRLRLSRRPSSENCTVTAYLFAGGVVGPIVLTPSDSPDSERTSKVLVLSSLSVSAILTSNTPS